ncbi:response regulator [Natrinema salifodinae]|uniref:Response regulator receiver domain-containing protein n=1 Tax=Natrinema salifodinae TaxID=1202768 RepID=A0A1I0PGG8_9EURY|nr:response regulator [Natrinema salifodinae]SEW13417.1 Response regulator receiver domain-containing protein [Natrinema salifodinae]
MSDSAPNTGQPPVLLLIEDNPGDARLVEEALRDDQLVNALQVVSAGDDALDFVHQRGDYADAPRPDLVLLDWNLPGTDGEDVLAELKDDPELEHIPVIVLTGSQSEKDVSRAYKRHANACITKAGDADDYIETLRTFEDFWLSTVRLPTSDELQ